MITSALSTGQNASMLHPLGNLIQSAFEGDFPPPDGGVTVLPPPREGVETVMAFTGHAVVATSGSPNSVLAQRPDGFGGAVTPKFLLWLAGVGGRVGSHDVVMVASGRGDATLPLRSDLDAHPRVRHARSLRDSVVVYGDDRGVVTVGIGIGGLPELSVEVDADKRSKGAGRSLITDALGIIRRGELVVAEAAPGNAQSLRAFLACGFKPIGSAIHIQPGQFDRGHRSQWSSYSAGR